MFTYLDKGLRCKRVKVLPVQRNPSLHEPVVDWCKFLHDSEFLRHMSQNIFPSLSTQTIFHQLHEIPVIKRVSLQTIIEF